MRSMDAAPAPDTLRNPPVTHDATLTLGSWTPPPPSPMDQVLRQCSADLGLPAAAVHGMRTDVLLVLASLRFHGQSRLRAAGIQLEWSVQRLPQLPGLDAAAALHLLHIVTEVVANVIQHAAAGLVRVSTHCEAGYAVVRIDDDGRGFDGPRGGLMAARGLGDIVRRARALQGMVWWSRQPVGTRFELRLPLPARAA